MRKQPVPAEVEDYFDDLQPAERAVLYPVIDAVRDAIPFGYELGMHRGVPGWVIPLVRYPQTPTGQPLPYVSLAAGGAGHSLWLTGLTLEPRTDAAFRADWAATGRVLDLEHGCLRFRTLADVDLDILARTVASMSVERYLAVYSPRVRPAPRAHVGVTGPVSGPRGRR